MYVCIYVCVHILLGDTIFAWATRCVDPRPRQVTVVVGVGETGWASASTSPRPHKQAAGGVSPPARRRPLLLVCQGPARAPRARRGATGKPRRRFPVLGSPPTSPGEIMANGPGPRPGRRGLQGPGPAARSSRRGRRSSPVTGETRRAWTPGSHCRGPRAGNQKRERRGRPAAPRPGPPPALTWRKGVFRGRASAGSTAAASAPRAQRRRRLEAGRVRRAPRIARARAGALGGGAPRARADSSRRH